MGKEMRFVCESGDCSACRSCEQVCPVRCISFINNAHETRAAVYDEKRCVSCGRCKVACPQINTRMGVKPKKCYAAWSQDSNVRSTSASGGIATEIYRYFSIKDGLFGGVKLDTEFSAVYELCCASDNVLSFQNSKYVESDTNDIYTRIGDVLKHGKRVVFIGLPCHVAGLKGYLDAKNVPQAGLTVVDIVCHGTTPSVFLKQHIKYIETTKHQKATSVSFREPTEGTHTFTFSLLNNSRIFYKKKVHRNDSYQIGYHYGITYRDNCYSCLFANSNRQGDITISDFSGLGKEATCEYNSIGVSCILVNTDKGEQLIQAMVHEGFINVDERPLVEALKYEKQLNAPSLIQKERNVFIAEYERTGKFEEAMYKATRIIVFNNEIRHFLHIEKAREVASRILPKQVKQVIKKLFGIS